MRPSLLALLAFALPAAAAESAPGGDRVVAGPTVRVTQPISGGLFGFGGDFELSAPVRGDAFLGGGNVRAVGPVQGDLYGAGGNVVLSGPVHGNAHLAGGNVEITPEAEVRGDLFAGGGDVDIRGPVKGSVHAGGGQVRIDAAVDGDVHVASGDLDLGPGARIGGRLVHHGASLRRDDSAQVLGGVTRETREAGRKRVRAASESAGWLWTFGLVALAALIAGIFPAASRQAGEQMRREPGITFFAGFVALVCVPVAAVVLMITIIGIPVAIVALLGYFLLLMVGYAAAGVILGDAALQRLRAAEAGVTAWRVGAAVLAMLALALLTRIPVLGGLVVFAALLAGIGAVVMLLAQKRPEADPPAAPLAA